ncbi:MAG: HAD-IA family hydrolase [Erysipelotrichaceae bacterium]|nr:HAD-IA family hydrolase [Erysipelotrichaceae bacterium]
MKHHTYIWDLDGTLIDSYGVISRSLKQAFEENGTELELSYILECILRESVTDFIRKMNPEIGADAMKKRYAQIGTSVMNEIPLVCHAKETLVLLQDAGCTHFVYTHRGDTSRPILENLGIIDCFKELVTAESGFLRKPDGSAIEYLVKKYNLDKNTTFYVGDRTIDMMCAKNAGIQGILYHPEGSVVIPNGDETVVVTDLLEIVNKDV